MAIRKINVRLPVQQGPLGRKLRVSHPPTVSDINANPGPWEEMDSSRVARARYDYGKREIHVIFKDGTPWVYGTDGSVPTAVWHRMRRTASPGKFINRVLNDYPYSKAPPGYFDHLSGKQVTGSMEGDMATVEEVEDWDWR
jgi:hypothetical protein